MAKKMRKSKLIILLSIFISSCMDNEFSNIDVELIKETSHYIGRIDTRQDYYVIHYRNDKTLLLSLCPESRIYYKNIIHNSNIDNLQNTILLINMLEKYNFSKFQADKDYIFTKNNGKKIYLSNDTIKWHNEKRIKIDKEWFYIEKK